MQQSRQLAAIMFTDIVGYTALMGNDEQKAFDLLRKNREIQKPVIEEYGGTWVKELGDGVLASFPSVSNAVYAALKIQEICKKAAAFSLRIGLHQGEIIVENGDIFGDTVNIASRLQTLATPGGIYVSESVHRNITNKQEFRSVFVGMETLKNVREPVAVYSVVSASEEIPEYLHQNQRPSSIYPGYDCDIYISYRANDNQYDGWVTEFASKLERELGATVKDKLTIWFDKSAETLYKHPSQVADGEGKWSKSIIFIPIVSQTYCDPASLTWQMEFKGFKDAISRDSIGPTVKLLNGNTVSRILPVRIHDIDADDVRLLESEVTGGLRSIDFIYRDPGINRPLRPLDDEKNSESGRPMYRNQINKLANAVKEIVQGIRSKDKAEAEAPAFKPEARQIIPNVFSAPVSAAIKVQVIDRQRPSIYLAWTSSDLKESREEMSIILQKAGFNVLPSIDCPADDATFKQRVQDEMDKCVCSLHMLSGEFGRRFESDEETSFPQYQFEQARLKVNQPGDGFNVFIWLDPEHNRQVKPAQQQFIKNIRNNITRNMMFSNSNGPMQLVDDIRVVMMKQDAKVYDSKDTEIFFIFNQQDELDAQAIVDRLSLEFPVETMNILPDGEESYRDMSSQQIPKSKLAVVYFKYAADWALPFIKQIWKQVGGASSPTPMFLVGEDDPRTNLARNFKAPRVISTIVPKELIPEEVKKVYGTLS
jgi:class 3 adenylate cyclase